MNQANAILQKRKDGDPAKQNASGQGVGAGGTTAGNPQQASLGYANDAGRGARH